MLQDEGLTDIREKISAVMHDDTRYLKNTLNMQLQKCHAIKVSEGKDEGPRGLRAPNFLEWSRPRSEGLDHAEGASTGFCVR